MSDAKYCIFSCCIQVSTVQCFYIQRELYRENFIMILIAAVDDRNGMTFNGRRLSQDRVLRARILEEVLGKGCRLWMNAYTRKLFTDLTAEEESLLVTDEEFLLNVPADDTVRSGSRRLHRMQKVLVKPDFKS